MASNDDYASDFGDSDTDVSDSDSDQPASQVCIYYNKGTCCNGKMCKDLHVCEYYLKGYCRYGNSCRLNHVINSNQETRSSGKGTCHYKEGSHSSSSDSHIDTSEAYRWQLNMGGGWKDIANDFILEAQFSRPNTKGIRIYNTPWGTLSVDFTTMRISEKYNLQVRRKGSRHSNWVWYYRGNGGWCEYGKKDAHGTISPVNSATLESKFQMNECGTVHFTINSTTYEIQFKDMYQKNLTTGHKRKIRRRPIYVSSHDQSSQSRVNTATDLVNSMWPSSSTNTPLWQFSGNHGNWHDFKPRSCCSVSSAEIETQFQLNPYGSMNFTANGDQYTLNFSRKQQTNLKTGATRAVRRLEP